MNAKKKKKTSSRTKYLKTHVQSVILNMIFPNPQLDINFETNRNFGDDLYHLYKYIYIHVLYT